MTRHTKAVQVKFIPQGVVRGYIITLDPNGPDTYQVPRKDACDKRGRLFESHSYESDVLKDHPNAPGWVRDHHGPFEIEVGP